MIQLPKSKIKLSKDKFRIKNPLKLLENTKIKLFTKQRNLNYKLII